MIAFFFLQIWQRILVLTAWKLFSIFNLSQQKSASIEIAHEDGHRQYFLLCKLLMATGSSDKLHLCWLHGAGTT